MARRCSICAHPDAEQINQALISSVPLSEIAARFRLAQSSLSRHRTNHLAPKYANALARFTDVDAERLTAWLVGLHEQTLFEMARAKGDQDRQGFRALLAEARKNIELLGRVAGVLDGPTVHVDARRQMAVVSRLAELSEDDLRALASAADDRDVIAGEARELPEPVEA